MKANDFLSGNYDDFLGEVKPQGVAEGEEAGTFSAITSGLAKGLTMGFDDEIIGGLRTMIEDGVMPWDDNYSENYQRRRSSFEDRR